MKKFGICFLLLLFILSPVIVHADGYVLDNEEEILSTKDTRSYEEYSNEITKQEVKSPNTKHSSATLLVVSFILVTSVGTYFVHQKKSRPY